MQKIKRDYNLSPVEFYRFQLNNIINHSLPILSQTDITILAYVHLFGRESQKLLLSDRIFTHPKSVTNAVMSLYHRGFIVKPVIDEQEDAKRPKTELALNPDINLIKEDFIQINVVKIDPASDEVFHKYFRK